jgi:DNA repair exonuclease SbcCD ATPase subunit
MEDLKLFKQQCSLLEKYDSLCKKLKEEFDGDSNEEILNEKLMEERRKLLSQIDPLIYQNKDNIEKVYEAVLYDALYDQLKRSVAYYKAYEKHKKNLKEFNNALGERIFEVMDEDRFIDDDKLKILDHLDTIYFVRLISLGLGIMPEDTDKIINHMIDEYFHKGGK